MTIKTNKDKPKPVSAKTTAKPVELGAATETTMEVPLETHKVKKDRFDKNMADWSPEELKEHVESLKTLYGVEGNKVNYLGDFSFDPYNTYYWHGLTSGNEHKLKKRFALGYRYATKEDAEKAKLASEISISNIDGGSAVVADHKSHKSLLLKIPKALYELNRKMARETSAIRSHRDVEGELVKLEERIMGDRIEVTRNEKEISTNDL